MIVCLRRKLKDESRRGECLASLLSYSFSQLAATRPQGMRPVCWPECSPWGAMGGTLAAPPASIPSLTHQTPRDQWRLDTPTFTSGFSKAVPLRADYCGLCYTFPIQPSSCCCFFRLDFSIAIIWKPIVIGLYTICGRWRRCWDRDFPHISVIVPIVRSLQTSWIWSPMLPLLIFWNLWVRISRFYAISSGTCHLDSIPLG